MELNNILDIASREQFRNWLSIHSKTDSECWIKVKRGKPISKDIFYYLDAVEEAICFGWIDSIQKEEDGIIYQRFSPRKNKSNWTELNKERARRLIKLGLMTKEGKKVLPSLGMRSFKIDEEILLELKKNRCYKMFKSFPPLYQRVKASNIAFYKTRDINIYQTMLTRFILETKKGHMYGEWNDYGRLLDY